MSSVSGIIFISDSDILNMDVRVQIDDIDLPSKQLLGEIVLPVPIKPRTNTFQIRYSSRQYEST